VVRSMPLLERLSLGSFRPLRHDVSSSSSSRCSTYGQCVCHATVNMSTRALAVNTAPSNACFVSPSCLLALCAPCCARI
jgi:hypothetical protein